MNSLRFHTNSFICSEYFNLFQSQVFYNLHASRDSVYFELVRNHKTLACAHFAPSDALGTWRSPVRGTFSGISFTQGVQLRELAYFIGEIENTLKGLGAKAIEVLPAPQSHNEAAFSTQVYILRSFGFEISRCDINQSLQVDARSLPERMSYGNRKRLKKCQKEGFFVGQVPLFRLGRVYETLKINREAKGNRLSMTLTELEMMAERFPNEFTLFGCGDSEHFISAAICLAISSEILYVFYWGDRPEYSTYSPVVPLANEIYNFAQGRGISILDVGTSTLDKEPNFGLIEFKNGLGFSESLKVRLRKTL